MKSLLVGIIAAATIFSPAFAKDSLWGLGYDSKVALNLFEHRAGGTSREADITLIMGSWFLSGKVVDSGNGYPNPGAITLTGRNGSLRGVFRGTIRLDFTGKKMRLKGTLTLGPASFILDETIRYRELNGL